MKIVAIDFETANRSSCSACSLGLSIYEDGIFVDNYAFYILPPINHRDFCFTYIHGLTLNDVKDAEEFPAHYNTLVDLFEGAILVAHNANFDISVLNAMCDYYGLDHFPNLYIDTVSVARKMYPFLPNHRLNTVSEYLDIELNHHEAGSDANACLLILIYSMQSLEIYDIQKFMRKINVKIFINS